MDASDTGVENAVGEDFSKYKRDGLKKYLKERGIQLSDAGCRVGQFVWKSSRNKASKEKLQRDDGKNEGNHFMFNVYRLANGNASIISAFWFVEMKSSW